MAQYKAGDKVLVRLGDRGLAEGIVVEVVDPVRCIRVYVLHRWWDDQDKHGSVYSFYGSEVEQLAPVQPVAPVDCWQVLGVEWCSPATVVKAAYRQLCWTRHPDRGGSHEQFVQLRAAYEEALRLIGAWAA